MFERRLWVLTTMALLAVGLQWAPVRAQRNQPIYPAYDGFLKNPDGSYTLSFAYFSHNADTVTIPSGADNAFSPAPGDRHQPITFHPGHHRFQCVIVLGPEFDGKLRWTLAYAGTSTATSQNMLQSNWNLVEGAAEMRMVDFAKAPKGVCLNRPPTVEVLGLSGRGRGVAGAVTVRMGEAVNLFGNVEDEGLPRTGILSIAWKQVSGAGTVTFSNPSAARTHASFSAPGAYQLELSATDSEFSRSTRVNVTVTAVR